METQTEIFFINGNFIKKGDFYSVFRASMPAISQNNHLKIIPMPKRHIWGWHILLLFTGFVLRPNRNAARVFGLQANWYV